MDEHGFTVAEAIAALLILSVAALQIGEISLQFATAYRHAQSDIAVARDVLRAYRISARPAAEPLGESDAQSATQIVLDGRTFTLSQQAMDEDEGCLFDVVGRRCR